MAIQSKARGSGMPLESSSCSISWPSESAFPRMPCQIVQPISTEKTPSSTHASWRVIDPSRTCHAASAVMMARMGSSLRSTCECTVMGLISAVRPSTRAILVMLEP